MLKYPCTIPLRLAFRILFLITVGYIHQLTHKLVYGWIAYYLCVAEQAPSLIRGGGESAHPMTTPMLQKLAL